ncbi:MAG: hypothetical protein NT069_05980, partial [Planctomycetota bacterium]|nr:hypothetical protein [Planctomycetota bacterium]
MCDRRCWIRLLSVLLVILLEDNCSAQARRDPTTSLSKTNDGALPGTSLLTTKEPLDEVMIAGLRRFCLRELSKAKDNRAARREADAITDEK